MRKKLKKVRNYPDFRGRKGTEQKQNRSKRCRVHHSNCNLQPTGKKPNNTQRRTGTSVSPPPQKESLHLRAWKQRKWFFFVILVRVSDSLNISFIFDIFGSNYRKRNQTEIMRLEKRGRVDGKETLRTFMHDCHAFRKQFKFLGFFYWKLTTYSLRNKFCNSWYIFRRKIT